MQLEFPHKKTARLADAKFDFRRLTYSQSLSTRCLPALADENNIRRYDEYC